MYLHVGTKLTKKIDIGSALFNAIKDGNSHAFNTPLLDACKAIGVMRGDVTNISYLDASLTSTDGRRVLLEYYRSITAVSPRIPPDYELQSECTWYDAFDKDACVAQRYLTYERMAVLYNIAASHAASAYSTQRSDTTEDLKQVLHLFQLAAGYFDAITETPLKGSLTVDMYPESVKVVKLAMLVNAQIAFAQVAARNHTSHKVRARLAAGVRDLCNEIVRRAGAQGIGGSQLDHQLGKSAQALALYFDAEAHSQRAHVCGEEHIMDERLTRLSTSLSLVNVCRTKTTQLPKTADVNNFRNTLLAKLTSLERDLLSRQKSARAENDSFHFKTPLETVPPVVGHLSAKATDVSHSLQVKDEDELVAKLAAAVPPKAKGVAAKYATAAFDLVNGETAKLRSSGSNLRDKITQAEATLSMSESVLSSGNNGSAANAKSGPDDHVTFAIGMESLAQLKREGGLEHLREREQMVKTESAKTRELLKRVQNVLAVEEAEDNRIQHAAQGRATRPQSRELNARYHTKINQILNAFENAGRADSFVAAQIQEHGAAILRASRAEIGDQPSGLSNGSQLLLDPQSCAENLRAHVMASKKLVEEQDQIVRNFESLASRDPVEMAGGAETVANVGKEDESRVCEAALSRNFDPLKTEASECQHKMDRMCQTIDETVNAYRQSFSHHTNSSVAKTELYAHFPAAAKYKELLDYISQGADYYRKEQEIIRQLQKDVDKFVASRETGLPGQFAGMNMGGFPQTGSNYYPGNFPPQR
eukprot:Plantae.Rhodophyta-Hildenbrandia_rubra.ctg402.p1 GENE.Plantae.Rhodophyta-Hildenbrandia_rubra.ctg402~~Plantae.Rhodophyta-Hildenbrandia_rubra.ctg402.p1  ORF type:complete len:762 (-),score=158.84 Plantae.Rhodophyta-Hildenbrandia_rubra.ctg402:919-3204(-)